MYQLQPLTVGEILDVAFALFRRHFGTFLAIGAVCTGPAAAVQVYVSLGGGVAVHPWAALLYLLLSFVGGLVASGAALRVISDIYLGREVDVRGALMRALGKMGPLFVAGMATALIAALGALLLIVPGIILWCRYALATQVVILEDLDSGMDALPRSRELTDGYKWKVFGASVVTFLAVWIPLVAVSALLPGPVGEVLGVLFSLVLYPVFYTVFTLLYYDLRVRKEGFDLELLGRLTAQGEIA
jgi:uncharacterized membrane protein